MSLSLSFAKRLNFFIYDDATHKHACKISKYIQVVNDVVHVCCSASTSCKTSAKRLSLYVHTYVKKPAYPNKYHSMMSLDEVGAQLPRGLTMLFCFLIPACQAARIKSVLDGLKSAPRVEKVSAVLILVSLKVEGLRGVSRGGNEAEVMDVGDCTVDNGADGEVDGGVDVVSEESSSSCGAVSDDGRA